MGTLVSEMFDGDPSGKLKERLNLYLSRGRSSQYDAARKTLMAAVQNINPNASGKGWEDAIAYALGESPPPKGASAEELKAWARSAIKQVTTIAATASTTAQNRARRAAGGTSDGIYTNSDKDPANAVNQRYNDEFGNFPSDQGIDDKKIEDFANSFAASAYNDPSIVGATSTDPNGDYAARLKAFRDALYNQGTANRLGDMAASQAERSTYYSGVRGGAAQQGVGANVADAALKYQQNVDAQAMQLIGMEDSKDMNAASLAQQAAMFNAQQSQAAQQAAYQQRAQLGGTIGGIAGGVLGGVIQAYTGAPVASAFTSAGTGLGSMAGAGSAPGGSYVYSRGSLGNYGKKSGGGNNGAFGS